MYDGQGKRAAGPKKTTFKADRSMTARVLRL